jgi:precorrin-6B methylase 1
MADWRGTGRSGLHTRRKAEHILSLADVVVHDRLVGAGILALAAPTARQLYVGKRKSCHSVPQSDLNGLLVALAREGLQVSRLKGGDLFDRGGDELLACRAAGVACEVVPGVSAALAAAASAGVPTHLGMAQVVTFVTGHATIGVDGEATEPDLDWSSRARATQPDGGGLDGRPVQRFFHFQPSHRRRPGTVYAGGGGGACQPPGRAAFPCDPRHPAASGRAADWPGRLADRRGRRASRRRAAGFPCRERRTTPVQELRMSTVAITANRLRDGEAVFWAKAQWVTTFDEAELFATDEAADAALTAARAQPDIVVETYMIDVVHDDGLPIPTAFRERVRALGPTIHPDLGKQAEGGAMVVAMRTYVGGTRSSGRLSPISRKP